MARDARVSLDLLDEHQLAEQLGRHVQTLRTWRRTGKGPRFVKVGKGIYYAAETVRAWLRSLEADAAA